MLSATGSALVTITTSAQSIDAKMMFTSRSASHISRPRPAMSPNNPIIALPSAAIGRYYLDLFFELNQLPPPSTVTPMKKPKSYQPPLLGTA